MHRASILIWLCIVVILPSCTGLRFPAEQLVERQLISRMVIQGAKVFDGKSEALSGPSDVWIENGKITRVATTGEAIPEGFEVIQGQGKVVMPGLIDTHVHLGGSGSAPWKMVKADVEYNLQAYLYAGITTVYELGGFAPKSKKLREKIEAGKLTGPGLYFTHMPITVEGSHPIPLGVVTSPFPLNKLGPKLIPKLEDTAKVEKVVLKIKKMGVHYLKAICDQIPPGSPEMSQELLSALVKYGHKHGLKVIVHTGSAENTMKVVRAGGDVIAHGIWRSPVTEEEAQVIADSGIPMIYTLAGFENVDAIHEGHFHPNHLDSTLVPPVVLEPVTGTAGEQIRDVKVMGAFSQDVHDKKPHWNSNFDKLQKAGVKILVGTDSALPGTWPGATFHQEMALLHEYGMRNFDVLKGATSEAAKMFLEKPDFGVVQTGMRADLLLVDGNPLEDLNTLQNPVVIIANGKVIKRLK